MTVSDPNPPELARKRRERDLARLSKDQHGMVARRQLTAIGIDWDAVDANVAAHRWVVRSPRVISTFTGHPTVEQQRWLGVLHAGPRSLLGGLTAAGRHRLTGWERDEVTVLVDDELSFEPVEGIRFFRSRRPFDLLQSPKPGIPSAQLEPAVLLWAGYFASPKAALGVVAAAVQQRLTTAERLVEWVDRLRPLRRSTMLKRTLSEIAGGSHSGAELEVLRMCRRYGLRRPDRQVPRLDSSGRRRWTDCEWDLPGGLTLVLEVDGSFHMEVAQWTADLGRGRKLISPERLVVRCTAAELRLDDGLDVARDLMALGLTGRLPGDAA